MFVFLDIQKKSAINCKIVIYHGISVVKKGFTKLRFIGRFLGIRMTLGNKIHNQGEERLKNKISLWASFCHTTTTKRASHWKSILIFVTNGFSISLAKVNFCEFYLQISGRVNKQANHSPPFSPLPPSSGSAPLMFCFSARHQKYFC